MQDAPAPGRPDSPAPTSAPAHPTPRPSGRIIGLDVARGLAIVGMFAAHVAPNVGGGERIWDGRSSVLFAVLAGVSLGLMTGGRAPVPRGGRGRQLLSILLRGVFLLLLGLMLGLLGTPIAIILTHYGIMFAIALLFVYAPRPLLVGLVLLFAIAGPLVVDAVADARDTFYAQPGLGLEALVLDQPFVWLTQYYPVPAWLAYLALGILIARCDVRSPKTQLALVGGGIASAVFGYGGGLLFGGPVEVEAHASTTWELFGAGGVSAAVIGALVSITASAPASVSASGRRALSPLAAIGAMPLTIYSVQIVVLAVYLNGFENVYAFDEWTSWWLLAGLIAGSVAFALLWQRFVSRQGPLEWLFARITLRGPGRTDARRTPRDDLSLTG